MSHRPALEAADDAVFTREAIVAMSQKRGRPAVLLPKLLEGQSASGAHLHISIHREGSNMISYGPQLRYGQQDLGEHFLGRVLEHLPDITSFLAGSTNSYRRMKPLAWVGAYQAWEINNRETPIRLITGSATAANCEIKIADAISNPHVAIAATAVAGLLGLRTSSKLTLPAVSDPHLQGPHLGGQGSTCLSASLDAALDALDADTG